MSSDVRGAQKELDGRVLGKPGIAGTAIGQKDGRPCLKVYLSDASAKGSVPGSIRGIPVVVETTGKFRKL